MCVWRHSPQAVPLSSATIFGAAIANFLVFGRAFHPNVKYRPLIDFNLVRAGGAWAVRGAQSSVRACVRACRHA